VAVFESRPGSTLWGRWYDTALKEQGERYAYRRLNLKTRDKAAAKQWAKERAGELMAGVPSALTSRVPTVDLVFPAYGEALADSQKCQQRKDHEERTMEMWATFLGPHFDLRELTVAQWTRFKRDRASGALSPRGTWWTPRIDAQLVLGSFRQTAAG